MKKEINPQESNRAEAFRLEMLAYYAKQGCEVITLNEIPIPFVTN